MLTSLREKLAFLANPQVAFLLVLALGVGAEFASESTVQLWSFVLINVLIAQSINLLTGVAGQISLGHAAFLGIGAYVSALLLKTWGVPLPLAIVAATLLSAAMGWLLSFAAGRVREFYLAMMTLGFGMIFYELIREWTGVTGGVAGLSGVPAPSLKTLKFLGIAIGPVAYFQFMLAVTAVVIWQLRNLLTSPYGRAFFAIHASEVAAGSIGVARVATKREAYTLSAALTGLAGGFYAHLVGYLGPESFGLHRSVEALVMAVVGGLGNLSGPVLGAIVFTYMPEKLQFFADWQFMVYGLLLMFSFVLLPKGLAGLLLPRANYIKLSAQAAARLSSAKGAVVSSPGETVALGKTDRTALAGAPLLVAKDIELSFLGLRALDGVTLEIHPGQIIGLVGPNGSGKSTLVNVISGIYQPNRGTVTFEGRTISGQYDHEVAKLGVLRTFQDPRLVQSFTVRENVLLGMHRLYRQGRVAAAFNLPSAHREEAQMLARVNEALELTGLTALADMPVKDLPYGDQRMTELSRVLVADPRIVLLDEPAAGLSEGELVRLADVIRVLKEQAVSVVLIEHHMDFLDDLVDQVIVLESGKKIYSGDMEGMYRNPAVVAAYLGKAGRPEVAHA